MILKLKWIFISLVLLIGLGRFTYHTAQNQEYKTKTDNDVKSTKKLTDAEIKKVSKKLSVVEATAVPYRPESIWKSYQALESVLKVDGLDVSSPKLAAKAHRLMAGVLVAAGVFVPEHEQAQDIPYLAKLKKLADNVCEKASSEVEKCLKLDPGQKNATFLEGAQKAILKGGIDPGMLSKYLAVLLPAWNKKPQ